jgi:hypothetical protein
MTNARTYVGKTKTSPFASFYLEKKFDFFEDDGQNSHCGIVCFILGIPSATNELADCVDCVGLTTPSVQPTKGSCSFVDCTVWVRRELETQDRHLCGRVTRIRDPS